MMGAVAVAKHAAFCQKTPGRNASVHRGGTFMEAMDSLDEQIQPSDSRINVGCLLFPLLSGMITDHPRSII